MRTTESCKHGGPLQVGRAYILGHLITLLLYTFSLLTPGDFCNGIKQVTKVYTYIDEQIGSQAYCLSNGNQDLKVKKHMYI